MATFVALPLLDGDGIVVNADHIVVIDPNNAGTTSVIRLALYDDGKPVIYDIKMSPKDVWKAIATAQGRV